MFRIASQSLPTLPRPRAPGSRATSTVGYPPPSMPRSLVETIDAARSDALRLQRGRDQALVVVVCTSDVPARHVGTALERKLDELCTVFPPGGAVTFTLVIVDDSAVSSTVAATLERAPALHGRVVVIDDPGRGPRTGRALRRGLRVAIARAPDAIAVARLARAVDARQLATALDRLGAASTAIDVVIGSRARSAGGGVFDAGAWRELRTRAWRWLARRALHTTQSDPDATLEVYRVAAATRIVEHARVDGAAFASEWHALLAHAGMRAASLGVVWIEHPLDRAQPSLAALARDLWRVRRTAPTGAPARLPSALPRDDDAPKR